MSEPEADNMPLKPGRYYPGSPIRLTASFQDEDGDYIDPTTVAMRTISPYGVTNTYTYGTDAIMGRSSTGLYFADLTPEESGLWRVRWQTTGTNTTFAYEDRFNVNYSPFYDPALSNDYS